MKIVVRAPNWLGDAVMSTLFLRRLRETRPQDRLHVLCRPFVKEIFERFPGVDRVMEFKAGESIAALVHRLRAERFDMGYILPPSFSSALLFCLAGIPERIGYATDFRSLLLTKAVPLDERFHYVRRYLGLLGEFSREVRPKDLFFPEPKNVLERAGLLFSSARVPWNRPMLAVAPGSQAPARRWFPERFAELINGLSGQEWPTVVLLGGPTDAASCAEVARACRRGVINFCGKTSLIALGDFLRNCAALVTNESGMMHVAWAVGTPTVVLAGPSDPRITSPFGAQVRILQHREVPCVPCVKNDCYRPRDEYKECMRKIEVEEVRAALEDLLKSGEG